MNNEELEEKKKWFFKENIRLEELRKNLEQQQGKLEKEEQVVEIQKQMLECGCSGRVHTERIIDPADVGKAETQSGFAKKAVR